ncbi:hypothetical protein PF003_g25194 [Phytophthora fragariae]|nr:hypothetical protein PF003_g25194 [Phytophthora fragariae]
MLVLLRETVIISGTTGRIHIHTPAHLATEISVIRSVWPCKEEPTTTNFPWPNPDDRYSEAVTKPTNSRWKSLWES